MSKKTEAAAQAQNAAPDTFLEEFSQDVPVSATADIETTGKNLPAEAAPNHLQQMMEALSEENFNEDAAIDLAGEYLEMKTGEKKIVAVTGWSVAQFKPDEPVKDVALLVANENGVLTSYMAAQTALISGLKKVPVNVPVLIRCTGEAKSTKGKYQTWEVKVMPHHLQAQS